MPSDKKTSDTKLYASTTSPSLEAIMAKRFAFVNEAQAMDKITYLRQRFIIASEQESKDSVILWVKGFMIEEQEKKQGALGNYAKVKIGKTPAGRFTLTIQKIVKDVAQHPKRERQKRDVPDWGHFVLRAAQKRKVFATIGEAEKQLQLLHEEFPSCSIPANHRLYTYVYRKPEKGKPAVMKYILLIKALPEGGFILEVKLNHRKKKAAGEKSGNAENASDNTKGYFTAMVELRKK